MSVTTESGSLAAHPITGFTGAEVTGVVARETIDDAAGAFLRDALTAHAVIFLRDVPLDPARLIEIARVFGMPKPAVSYLENLSDAGFPEVGVISTESRPEVRQADNWHTDVAWGPEPLKATVLQMQAVPDAGGDTLWSNQYLAYEWLSDPLKDLLTPLSARHCVPHQPDVNAVHPLVIENPQTHRRALFFSPFYTKEVIGLSRRESDHILRLLADHCTQPDLMCRWNWRAGDVAVWDNHYTMHYAVSDYPGQYRKIHRVEVAGSAPRAAASST